MRRTLMTGVVLATCLYNPASAQIVCGDQPKIAATSSAEGFKADVSGKAQLLSKVLPSADINGKIDQWKTEQRQQYKDLDQHELTFYWVWVSCQMIATSKEMTAAQKTEQWNKVHAAFSTPPHEPGPPQYSGQSSQPSPDDARVRFGPSAIRFKGKEITVSNCGVGGCGVTVRFSVENASGVDIEAALRRGSISVGSCTNIETSSSGLPYALGAGSERMTWSNMAKPAQPRFLAAGGRVEATIATPYSDCTDTLRGIKTTDIAMSIAVTWSSKTFDIPLSAEAVPVRWVDRR